jgi:hypothetical protein
MKSCAAFSARGCKAEEPTTVIDPDTSSLLVPVLVFVPVPQPVTATLTIKRSETINT